MITTLLDANDTHLGGFSSREALLGLEGKPAVSVLFGDDSLTGLRLCYAAVLFESTRLPAEICWIIGDLVAVYRTSKAWHKDYNYKPSRPFWLQIKGIESMREMYRDAILPFKCKSCATLHWNVLCPECHKAHVQVYFRSLDHFLYSQRLDGLKLCACGYWVYGPYCAECRILSYTNRCRIE